MTTAPTNQNGLQGLRGWDGKNNQKQEKPTPCLLINVGTGVSILSIGESDGYERIGGSVIGGGLYCHVYFFCPLRFGF